MEFIALGRVIILADSKFKNSSTRAVCAVFFRGFGGMKGILFGTAGTPTTAKGEGSLEGIREVNRLGLGCFEFEFVQSARMRPELSTECGDEAKKLGVALSAHAPYFVNLISPEKEKRAASAKRVLDTARILSNAGGREVVFHPGFFQKLGKKEAWDLMVVAFGELVDAMKAEKLTATLAPETTGKHSAWGSLEETVLISKEFGFEKVALTIDFGHLHARLNGGIKKREDFGKILDFVKGELGQKALENLHCHVTGMHYSEKGELHHLEISSKSPDYSLLWPELVERKCGGTFISESPNIERDALVMKREYEKVFGK